MRNAHEAFRGIDKDIRAAIAGGDFAKCASLWGSLYRALAVHVLLEDAPGGMFGLIDILSGGDVTRAHLAEEHDRDHVLTDAVNAMLVSAGGDVRAFTTAYEAWWDHFDDHMRHEEVRRARV